MFLFPHKKLFKVPTSFLERSSGPRNSLVTVRDLRVHIFDSGVALLRLCHGGVSFVTVDNLDPVLSRFVTDERDKSLYHVNFHFR